MLIGEFTRLFFKDKMGDVKETLGGATHPESVIFLKPRAPLWFSMSGWVSLFTADLESLCQEFFCGSPVPVIRILGWAWHLSECSE